MNLIDKTGQSFETTADFDDLFLDLAKNGGFNELRTEDVKVTPEAYLSACKCCPMFYGGHLIWGDYTIRLHL